MDLIGIIALTTTIVGVGFLIVNSKLRNKKREKKDLQTLREFAGASGASITAYDRWDKTMIGLGSGDRPGLFFIRNANNEQFRVSVPLPDVMDCRLVKEERNVRYGEENVTVIDRITLVLTLLDVRKPRLSLAFYNSDYDHLTITVELNLALKWQGMIKDILAMNVGRINVKERVDLTGRDPSAGKAQQRMRPTGHGQGKGFNGQIRKEKKLSPSG